MAFIATPDTAEVEVVAELLGQIIENTLFFETDGGWLESSLTQLATSVMGWWIDNLIPQLTADYKLLRVQAKDISVSTGAMSTVTPATATPGAIVGNSAPGGTCAAISFRTGLSGRSFRGRNYISGLPLNNLLGNQWNAAMIDDIVDAYQLLEETVQDDLPECEWVVVSKYAANAPRAAGVTTPITTCIATDYDVDSQRRRLAGRGS